MTYQHSRISPDTCTTCGRPWVDHDGWLTAPSLEASAVALGLRVLPYGRTDEHGAAALLGRSVGTLRNWRSQSRGMRALGPSFIGGLPISYAFAGLARYMNSRIECRDVQTVYR